VLKLKDSLEITGFNMDDSMRINGNVIGFCRINNNNNNIYNTDLITQLELTDEPVRPFK